VTLEEFVTRLERFRVEPEEEIRIFAPTCDTQTPQEIVYVQRLQDEDGNHFVQIDLRYT
jgi:hypothetical protein